MGVMVTGGTGLIGKGLVRFLLERDEKEITVFHHTAARKTLDDVSDRITLSQGDLGIFSHVLERVKECRPRVIYHLGAMVTALSQNDPPRAFQTNVAGTFHILEAARLFDVEQVIFASSIGSYGLDIRSETIDDDTIQRPESFYGAAKVFGEHLGLCYRRKYGLDFRGIRFPGIMGPGFINPSLAQFASQLVEESFRGRPHTLKVAPDVRHPFLYYKDAALAMIKLSQAPKGDIKRINYLLNGVQPVENVQELVDRVSARIPGTHVAFEPDPELCRKYYEMRPFDDRCAREEWGWRPEYDHERMLDDFIAELHRRPESSFSG